MQIIKDKIFVQNLKEVLKFISLDSKNKAHHFNNQLFDIINNLSNMPFKFRKSYYYNDDNIRDLIFKGYTIPYLINQNSNQIIILDIFKWSLR
jgi:hypothetical protein